MLYIIVNWPSFMIYIEFRKESAKFTCFDLLCYNFDIVFTEYSIYYHGNHFGSSESLKFIKNKISV